LGIGTRNVICEMPVVIFRLCRMSSVLGMYSASLIRVKLSRKLKKKEV